MSWHGIYGHDALVQRFRVALQRGRLASTFLFVGPAGVGKRAFANRLARSLLCETAVDIDLDPCGHCAACQQVEAETHPDLLVVELPEDKNYIPVNLFIGDKEHRMREGLCHDIALKPFRGGWRIAIVDDADRLNEEGANCLLKTLEEPPADSLIILIGTSQQQQLPTIRSRCQIVRFAPLEDDTLAQVLVEQRMADSFEDGLEVARRAGGTMQLALAALDQERIQMRSYLLGCLPRPEWNPLAVANEVSTYVDAAGREGAAKRQRLRAVIAMCIEFYRQLSRSLTGTPDSDDRELQDAVDEARRHSQFDVLAAMNGVERCAEAELEVDRNANQATLLECWLDDLARLARRVQAAGNRG